MRNKIIITAIVLLLLVVPAFGGLFGRSNRLDAINDRIIDMAADFGDAADNAAINAIRTQIAEGKRYLTEGETHENGMKRATDQTVFTNEKNAAITSYNSASAIFNAVLANTSNIKNLDTRRKYETEIQSWIGTTNNKLAALGVSFQNQNNDRNEETDDRLEDQIRNQMAIYWKTVQEADNLWSNKEYNDAEAKYNEAKKDYENLKELVKNRRMPVGTTAVNFPAITLPVTFTGLNAATRKSTIIRDIDTQISAIEKKLADLDAVPWSTKHWSPWVLLLVLICIAGLGYGGWRYGPQIFRGGRNWRNIAGGIGGAVVGAGIVAVFLGGLTALLAILEILFVPLILAGTGSGVFAFGRARRWW